MPSLAITVFDIKIYGAKDLPWQEIRRNVFAETDSEQMLVPKMHPQKHRRNKTDRRNTPDRRNARRNKNVAAETPAETKKKYILI